MKRRDFIKGVIGLIFAFQMSKAICKENEKKSESSFVMVIDINKCIGCGNCVVVCPVHVENDPYGCGSGLAPRTDKLILKVENGVVHILNMDMCRRYGKNRVLCVVCRENCPTDAISFLEG